MYPSSPPTTRSRLSGNMESDTNTELSLAPFAFSNWTDTRAASFGSYIHNDLSGQCCNPQKTV